MIGNSARNDQREILQVGSHVESETVRGNPPRDMNPDSANLALSSCGALLLGRSICTQINSIRIDASFRGCRKTPLGEGYGL
jgi:hypothetical protein